MHCDFQANHFFKFLLQSTNNHWLELYLSSQDESESREAILNNFQKYIPEIAQQNGEIPFVPVSRPGCHGYFTVFSQASLFGIFITHFSPSLSVMIFSYDFKLVPYESRWKAYENVVTFMRTYIVLRLLQRKHILN